MIVMTLEQANRIRGVTTLGHALQPRELLDGTYALNEAVLTDPAHAIHHAFLSTLHKRDVAANEWPTE